MHDNLKKAINAVDDFKAGILEHLEDFMSNNDPKEIGVVALLMECALISKGQNALEIRKQANDRRQELVTRAISTGSFRRQ